MQNIRIGSQLYIGQTEKERFSIEDIKARICRAKEAADLDVLAVWVHEDPDLFDRIMRICRECRIKAYLWFSVLADVPGYTIRDEDVVVTCAGQKGFGKTGRWPQLGLTGEDFLFTCPNKPGVVGEIFGIYKQMIRHPDLSGVMLDRIRYPSCVNGFETLFTCFCDACVEKFAGFCGGSLPGFKESIAGFIDRLTRNGSGAPDGRDGWWSAWDAAGLQPFSRFRSQSIFELVKRFSDEARVMGLKVGLDLYSSSLAPLVGQDYGLLSRVCDWIKPMSYCHAVGPAALPLEIHCLWQALEICCPDLKNAKRFLEEWLNIPLPDKADNLLQEGLPEAFFGAETEKARLRVSGDVAILAGIEAVQNPLYRIHVDGNILRRYLSALRFQPDGLMASWNLLYIPDENLKILRSDP